MMAPALAIISAFFYGVSMVLARIGLRTMDAFSGVLISIGFSFIASLVLFLYYVPISH
jgi:uncharacterized membrane protein